MKNSLFIGKLAGTGIYIHWTFPLIILWIILSNIMQGMGMEQIFWSVLFILTLFLCVVFHELGHALAAKHYQIVTKDITLLPIGGMARLERMPEKPGQELVVAFAGPAVNSIIAVLLYGFLNFVGKPIDISLLTPIGAGNFLTSLAVLNLSLAVFNMIPAFPMDRGRALRAVLSLWLGRVTATRIAARIGQLLALLLVLAGLLYNPVLIFIGLFVFLAAAAETEQVQLQALLKEGTVGLITMKDVPVLDRKDPIKKAIASLLNSQAKLFFVYDGSTFFETLGRDEIIKGIRDHTNDAPVEVVTDTSPRRIASSESIEKALLMLQQDKRHVLVVEQGGSLYGIVDNENMVEYLMLLNAVGPKGKLW